MALPYTKVEAKEWAKQHLRGLEAVIYPSFTPDLQELCEEGIRYDVNHLIANGFVSILCVIEACGLAQEERKRFMEIVCDEAKGRIQVSVAVMLNTVEENIEILQRHERVGGTMALLGHPLQYEPQSVEEIYRMYKLMCDSTNLAIQFYPARLKVNRFYPDWPLGILPRIAEIPNVVAMKIGGGSPLAFTAQCFHAVGDQILVADPSCDAWPVTVPKYGQQWAGAGPYFAFQVPEKPHIVNMFNMLLNNQMEEALNIYWQLTPVREVTASALAQISYPETGIVCGTVDKYLHWCNGGNGGMLRQPTGRLFDYQKEKIRTALRAVGLNPSEPEEEFYVGRVNYAKGARLKRY